MKKQLLDGTLVIASVHGPESEAPYASTAIYRMDIEGDKIDEFMKHLHSAPGLVYIDKVKSGVKR